jgi:hypothetical protein
MRKIINYPELLEDYLNGEKISYIGVKHDIHPANARHRPPFRRKGKAT